MRVSLFLLALIVLPNSGSGQEPATPRFATPHGYTRETANRKFVFVMLAPAGADLNALPRSYRAQTEELAKKYPASGLYRVGELNGEPLWRYSGPYAYDVYPTNDGIHLAILEGESWFTSQFVTAQKLPEDLEQAQLDGPAVTFFKSGVKLRSVSVRQVVGDPANLRHSPQHVQWRAGGAVVEKTLRFVLHTQDAQKVVFDLNNGEILSKDPAGKDAKYFLAAIGGVTVVTVFFAIWWLVRGPNPAAISPGALAGPAPAP